jgi:hypothetical protein
MLGDQIGELLGKVTGQRVIENHKVEVSYSGEGTFEGIPVTVIVTLVSIHLQDGSVHGKGKGIAMTKDSQDVATWTGQGIGRNTSSGAIRFIGSLFFKSQFGAKLGFLDNIASVFEDEIEDTGKTHMKIWNWK